MMYANLKILQNIHSLFFVHAGAVDPDTGNIYGIPSHSHQIICITPSTPDSPAVISTIPLPNEYQQGQFKWLRGVIHNGILYGIPAW